jgi:hypothetical protein
MDKGSSHSKVMGSVCEARPLRPLALLGRASCTSPALSEDNEMSPVSPGISQGDESQDASRGLPPVACGKTALHA